MRRKVLGAILLPIPFAALPVLIVVALALVGGKGADDELVTTTSQTPALQERVSSTSFTTTEDASSTLARVTTQDQPSGCEDDLSADF